MDGALWATMFGGFLGFMASMLPKVGEMIQGHLSHKHDHDMETLRIEASRTSGPVEPPPAPVLAPPPAPVVPAPCEPPVEQAPVFMSPGVEGEVVAPAPPAQEEQHERSETEEPTTPLTTDDEGDTVVKGSPFWTMVFDALRASVRPTITYGFFVLFVIIKLYGLWHGVAVEHTPTIQLLPIIWDDGSGSLFAAILSFWFGSRAFERSKALTGKAQ